MKRKMIQVQQRSAGRPVGVRENMPGRFVSQQKLQTEYVAQAEYEAVETQSATHFSAEQVRSVLQVNRSPDVPFDYSINPYRGCEHGCVYCFARPTHSYLELSPGLDFETRIFYKENMIPVLRRELSVRSYKCRTISIGVATDAYQPVEKQLGLTRSLLQFLGEHQHPVSLITKSSLILRDLDILAPLAHKGLVSVAVSVTTMDNQLGACLEPRAAAGQRRLAVIRQLSRAGVPVTLMIAPVIPFINDHEMERIIELGAEAGAQSVGYIVLRLPWEVKQIWRNWLHQNYPMRAGRVMQVISAMNDGKDYQSDWFVRQKGKGHWAGLLESRFRIAVKKYMTQTGGFDAEQPQHPSLRTDLFVPPERNESQLRLF